MCKKYLGWYKSLWILALVHGWVLKWFWNRMRYHGNKCLKLHIFQYVSLPFYAGRWKILQASNTQQCICYHGLFGKNRAPFVWPFRLSRGNKNFPTALWRRKPMCVPRQTAGGRWAWNPAPPKNSSEFWQPLIFMWINCWSGSRIISAKLSLLMCVQGLIFQLPPTKSRFTVSWLKMRLQLLLQIVEGRMYRGDLTKCSGLD